MTQLQQLHLNVAGHPLERLLNMPAEGLEVAANKWSQLKILCWLHLREDLCNGLPPKLDLDPNLSVVITTKVQRNLPRDLMLLRLKLMPMNSQVKEKLLLLQIQVLKKVISCTVLRGLSFWLRQTRETIMPLRFSMMNLKRDLIQMMKCK